MIPVVQTKSPREILRSVFGFDSFRPLQQEIIDCVLGGTDAVVVMPTGGGKSLCFQLPALVFDGLTVVVSPLISLMHDQVLQLRGNGVRACLLNSALDRGQYLENLNDLRAGRVDLLYLAPETLLKDNVLSLLRQARVACFAVDEAHCISEWGHDFRPEYRQLAAVRQDIAAPVCIALTATATPRVRQDIERVMQLRGCRQFLASFDRPNLTLRVTERTHASKQVLEFVTAHANERGIVYCGTRKNVDAAADMLQQHGVRALPYHAGMDSESRRTNQERFIRDDVDVIVATIAFGMGIDKPDVRFVLHRDLPKSLESYYQEIGRAGRDSLASECLMLHGPADIANIQYFIREKSRQEQAVAQAQLNVMLGYAESNACRRRPLLEYFGEAYKPPQCGACDNCLDPPELVDVTVPAQKLLSCVYRTGQRYGAGHVVDVLRGSSNQKVLGMGHDQLSTYGIGTELTRQQWMHMCRQLVQQGLLVQDVNHGGIHLAPSATPVLRGEQPVEGTIRAKSKERRQRKKRAAEGVGAYDDALFDRLRQLRKQQADVESVPPYVVASDRTLMSMAADLPRTKAAMLRVHGIGQAKLSRYGDLFMDAIKGWCAERGMADAAPEPDPEPEPERKSDRHMVVGRALAAGSTVGDLASTMGIKPTTIATHARTYLLEGHPIDPTVFSRESALSPADQSAVLAAIEAHGAEYLRPVFQALHERIAYDDLRLIQLAWLAGERTV